MLCLTLRPGVHVRLHDGIEEAFIRLWDVPAKPGIPVPIRARSGRVLGSFKRNPTWHYHRLTGEPLTSIAIDAPPEVVIERSDVGPGRPSARRGA